MKLIGRLLNWIRQNKYSVNTILVIMLSSGGYVIARSADYFENVAKLNPWIAWSAAIFMELAVIGGAAAMTISITHKLTDMLKGRKNTHWGVGTLFGTAAIIFGLTGTCAIAIVDSVHNNLDGLGVTAAITGQLVNLCFSLFFVYHACVEGYEKEEAAHIKYLSDCQEILRKQEEDARKKEARNEGMRKYRSKLR